MITKNKSDIAKSEQIVLNKSFDDDFDVLASEGLGYDGVTLQRNVANSVAQKITISGSSTYIAIAKPGTAQSTAKWQVKKIDETDANNVTITWADGNCNFDNTATDLTSLDYS